VRSPQWFFQQQPREHSRHWWPNEVDGHSIPQWQHEQGYIIRGLQDKEVTAGAGAFRVCYNVSELSSKLTQQRLLQLTN
jgi:hypothetical protein